MSELPIQHPSSSAVRMVVERLKKYMLDIEPRYYDTEKEYERDKYDPSEITIDFQDFDVHRACTTPGCLGAAYRLANPIDTSNLLNEPRIHLSDRQGQKWVVGAELMARDLGFGGREALENWANREPEIWGNSYGGSMFASPKAFLGHDPYIYGQCTLNEVIEHLEGVAARIDELQERADVCPFCNVYLLGEGETTCYKCKEDGAE